MEDYEFEVKRGIKNSRIKIFEDYVYSSEPTKLTSPTKIVFPLWTIMFSPNIISPLPHLQSLNLQQFFYFLSLTDLAPFVSHAILVICNFSSGVSGLIASNLVSRSLVSISGISFLRVLFR